MNENKKTILNKKKEKPAVVKDGEGISKKNSDPKNSKLGSSIENNDNEGLTSNSGLSKNSNNVQSKKKNYLKFFLVFFLIIGISIFLFFNKSRLIEEFNFFKDTFISSNEVQNDLVESDEVKKENENENESFNVDDDLNKKQYEDENVIEESQKSESNFDDTVVNGKEYTQEIDEYEKPENLEEELNRADIDSYDNQSESETNGFKASSDDFKSFKLSSEHITLINELQLLIDEVDKLEFSSTPSTKKNNTSPYSSDLTLLEKIVTQLKGLVNVRKINDFEANKRTSDFFILTKQQMKIYLLTARTFIANKLFVNAKEDIKLSLKILDRYFEEESAINQNYRNKLLFLLKKLEMISS